MTSYKIYLQEQIEQAERKLKFEKLNNTILKSKLELSNFAVYDTEAELEKLTYDLQEYMNKEQLTEEIVPVRKRRNDLALDPRGKPQGISDFEVEELQQDPSILIAPVESIIEQKTSDPLPHTTGQNLEQLQSGKQEEPILQSGEYNYDFTTSIPTFEPKQQENNDVGLDFLDVLNEE